MFEKISKEKWEEIIKCSPASECSNFVQYDEIQLPRRSTLYSAGYDFYSPVRCRMNVEKVVIIPTGIKVQLDKRDQVLMLYPRSSLGFKLGFTLSNTIPIIDYDYYDNPENEGHILVAAYVKRGDHTSDDGVNIFFQLEPGEKFCQGVVLNYNKLKGELPPLYLRTGGIGSTGK